MRLDMRGSGSFLSLFEIAQYNLVQSCGWPSRTSLQWLQMLLRSGNVVLFAQAFPPATISRMLARISGGRSLMNAEGMLCGVEVGRYSPTKRDVSRLGLLIDINGYYPSADWPESLAHVSTSGLRRSLEGAFRRGEIIIWATPQYQGEDSTATHYL